MINFLHTYGAFMLVVLVLLSPVMLLVFCRTCLRERSEPGDAAPRGAVVVSPRKLEGKPGLPG